MMSSTDRGQRRPRDEASYPRRPAAGAWAARAKIDRFVGTAVLAAGPTPFTPMPHRHRPRSIGALVASALLALAATAPRAEEARLGLPADMAARMAACTACHGEQGRAGTDGYYPRIAGKPADYLYHQLLNFRDGRRQYAPMTWLLENLPDAYLRDIATYFSEQHPPYPPPARANVPAATLARGEQLVRQGAGQGQPACAACHGADLAGVAPAIPGLLGLPRDYLLAQLGAWQSDTRRTPAPDCMAHVAKAIAPQDVAAVAAWLSSQPVPPGYEAREAPDLMLPLACHGVPQRGEAQP